MKRCICFVIFCSLFLPASCLPGQKQIGGKIESKAAAQTATKTTTKAEKNGGKKTYTFKFDPIVEFYGQAFPVQILSTATTKKNLDGTNRMMKSTSYIGDTLGNFGARISGLQKGDTIRVEVQSKYFIKPSPLQVTLDSDKTVEVFPAIKYNYDNLRRLKQPREEEVSWTLYINNNLSKKVSKIVDFRSLNEVPFLVLSRWDKQRGLDHSYMFAAMVNENAPFIDSVILKAGINSNAISHFSGVNDNSFAGYQDVNGDGNSTIEAKSQVFAIWYVLQNRKMRYSNIPATSNESDKVISQNVRSIEESFKNQQANCVDGSVLFASVLRKIGIDPVLVLVPGHMFIGFFTDSGHGNLCFLETTMLGDEDITKLSGKEKLTVSKKVFEAAIRAGQNNINKAGDSAVFIDIAECRKIGIKPVIR
jgi:hypothetical protein